MTTYICKYTPVELLEALGARMDVPNDEVRDFSETDTLIHPGVCSHAKLLLTRLLRTSGEGAEDDAEYYESSAKCRGGKAKDSEGKTGCTVDKAEDSGYGTKPGETGTEKKQDIAGYIESSKECSKESAKCMEDDAVCRACMGRDAEAVLTSCCDSIRRVYDTLSPKDFRCLTMLDLPHDTHEYAVHSFANELRRLCREYSHATGRSFNKDIFLEKWTGAAMRWAAFRKRNGGSFIALLGARAGSQLFEKLENGLPFPVIDLTCGGLRSLNSPPENAASMEDDALTDAYAEALLFQVPCMRMENVSGRAALLSSPGLCGIVYHSVKFCDYYSFEYASLRKETGVPILKIESDFTSQSEGQLATRIAAFSESVGDGTVDSGSGAKNPEDGMKYSWDEIGQNRNEIKDSGGEESGRSGNGMKDSGGEGSGRSGNGMKDSDGEESRRSGNGMKEESRRSGNGMKEESRRSGNGTVSGALYVGIDSGSTTTNILAMDETGKVRASAIIRTGARAATAAERALAEVRKQLGPDAAGIKRIIATGYGREFISFADGTKTEISCHAKGAHFAVPAARCVIDIGGQDSKVICLDEDGNVMNFVMNDKCAAGTGRFLEMMAQTLEMSLSEMDRLSAKWKKDLTISSTCTVFAESEVVSMIAENKDAADIIHALDKAVAAKTCAMVKRTNGSAPYMMTGGVANNPGVAREIEKKLGEKLIIMEHPDLIGALGAALFARLGTVPAVTN